MERLVLDTWTDNYYKEQTNGKWRCMGMSPQITPIDTIEYSLKPSNLKKSRFILQKSEINQLLLII